MARELGRYDTEIQMFVESPHEANMNHLRFMRRLMEAGKFDRKPLSMPRGDNVFRLSDVEIRDYAMQQADAQPNSQTISQFEQTIR